MLASHPYFFGNLPLFAAVSAILILGRRSQFRRLALCSGLACLPCSLLAVIDRGYWRPVRLGGGVPGSAGGRAGVGGGLRHAVAGGDRLLTRSGVPAGGRYGSRSSIETDTRLSQRKRSSVFELEGGTRSDKVSDAGATSARASSRTSSQAPECLTSSIP